MSPIHARVACALLAAGIGGCKGTKQVTSNVCTSNMDCPTAGTRCDMVTKQCVCKTDEACPSGQFCNRAGACQALAGCANNTECTKPNTYCDVTTGRCLTGPAQQLGSNCGLVAHCPLGTICGDGVCVAGCFDDGDCVLGQVCLGGQCGSGADICSNDVFCAFGQKCNLATTPGICRPDLRGPFCRGCTQRTVQNPEPCDRARNFCLVNSLEAAGHRQFCGVDCSLGQDCPNGYSCHGVVILTQSVCTVQAECRCDPARIRFATATCTVAAACDPRAPDGTPDPMATFCNYAGFPDCNGGASGGSAACVVRKGQNSGACTCATDDQCAAGSVCVAGLCCTGEVRPDRNCVSGENRVSGFCTCATDADCPQDVCDGGRRACTFSGLPCTPGANDCGAIPCINGGCVIGRNCAPIEGLSCSIITGR